MKAQMLIYGQILCLCSTHLRVNGWFWQHYATLLMNTECFLSSLRQIKTSVASFLFFLFDLFLAGHTDFTADDGPTVTTLKKQTSANHYHMAVSEIMLHLFPLRAVTHTACACWKMVGLLQYSSSFAQTL